MMSDSPEITRLLLPRLEVGISLNGHFSTFTLGDKAYAEMVEEGEIDPFNFTEIWIYLSSHIHEYLMEVVDEVGPIDPDKVKMLYLQTSIYADIEESFGLLDCEDCIRGLREEIEGEDDDDE